MVEDSNIDEENKQPKKESDLVKFLKKRSFIYLACAVVFVVFFVPEMLQPDDLEKIQIDKCVGDEQITACEIVKSYKGTDNEGSTLLETVIRQVENAYPTERILKHKDTTLVISVIDLLEETQSQPNPSSREAFTKVFEKLTPSGLSPDDRFYEVSFVFQTHDWTGEYVWWVNIDTNEFFGFNTGASRMLNIVNDYD